jgi:two-component system, NarL family, nitrate/nitrite response regulator NarL
VLQLIQVGGIYVPPRLLSVADQGAETAPSAILQSDAQTLTARQREVLKLLAEGCSNKDIARVLLMADGTVRTHVNAIFKVLAASNRTQAVMRAQQLGWL